MTRDLTAPAWAQAAIDHLRDNFVEGRWDPDGAVVARHGGVYLALRGQSDGVSIEVRALGSEALCHLVLEAAMEAELHRGLAEGARPETGCGCCDPACDPKVTS
jgi:hypothetical protein